MDSAVLRAELNCSICLAIYTDPVMLRCGHNFCQACIGNVLASQEEYGVYSCPECREEFLERPALHRNLKLSSIAECVLAAHVEQKETEILGTYCEPAIPAAKTCLHCNASLCQSHLQKHSHSKEHILSEPTHRRCSVHNEILMYYCCNDNVCICASCGLFGDHRGHQVEPLNKASEKKKQRLNTIMDQLVSKKENTDKQIQVLLGHMRDIQEKLSGLHGRVIELFKDIEKLLGALEHKVLGEITRQEEQGLRHISELVQRLELKKDEISKKILYIEAMHDTTDPLRTPWEAFEEGDMLPRDNDINPVSCLDEASISLMLDKGFRNFTDQVLDLRAKRQLPVLQLPDLLLDVTTANNYIVISDDMKSASFTSKDLRRPDGPERFLSCQVLSTDGFASGQHYWEVDVSKAKVWNIGVAYPSIERKIDGPESYIGFNKKSWSLAFQNTLGALHNKIGQKITDYPPLQTLGIFLNYEAGQLSFYEESDTKRHLHTFTATFTEPLHAAFFIPENSNITVRGGKGAYNT
ncbi:hypothetical protein XENTR_v10023940 [Xenopus tropicalis]|uniref:E3 ubiquitin-protein ligase TRIM39 n=1 Tax=Xenopus tropicalis TaxID=8364 RepID=A0A6I8S1E2_XENTR|nr:E3 ubiquitin-protein ligase TRIM39 [Xenopus tropicalis]KAE8579186.1 hypothetical protein XENTR_v10023940 [Xenopus tropicalis]